MSQKIKKRKPTVFSLFTGAGGMDIGFKSADFEIIGASDIWTESQKTMLLNFPKIPFICKDIRQVLVEEILAVTKGIKPDVFIGGPPCQGFSVMGDKNSGDPRNTLFESYVRLVETLRPKCFIFENVKGMQTMFNGRYLKQVCNSFSDIGYDIHLKVLNAKDYGVPQSRQRVIIFGTMLSNNFNFPEPSEKNFGNLVSYKNVWDAIGDLVKKDSSFPNHIPLEHGEIVIQRYKLIKEGGKLPPPEDLPKEIRRGNFGNTYVRLHRKRIATTMVPGNNAFPIHPILHRSLTPREAARIQTFPDSIIFSGPRKEQCKLVGNAVPPLMSAHIAKSVQRHLQAKEKELSKDLYLKRHNYIETKGANSNLGKKKKLKFIDLFAGAGGIAIGFEQAGFEHVLSADFDSAVAKTHRDFHKGVPFIEGDLSSKKVYKKIKDNYSHLAIDVLVGGPPCQGFSIFGKRRFLHTKEYNPYDDERNKLIFTFLKYVDLFKPKWFMMENVPGLVSLDEGWFLKELIKNIEKLGYKNHDYKVINTADYGVPQKRKRFILIANRTGNIIPWPKPKYFENPEDWQYPFRTINEVLTGLDSPQSYKRFKNHIPMNHAPKVVDRFSYIKEGKKINPEDLPKKLQTSKTGKKIQGFSKVFFRLCRNSPSPTLVPGHSAFPIHPWLNRQLTIREAARIQTFPDDIEFFGSVAEQCKQVGNAFPPMAAEAFANAIAKAISNNWDKESVSNLAYYSLISK
jgi:DNA (cytosine-5)-methyltransferase 1